MEIILMRHEKPVLAQADRITPTEMDRWIELYNLSVVKADSAPIASLQLVNSTTCIIASTAPRALLTRNQTVEQVFKSLPDIKVMQVNHVFNTDAPKLRPYSFKR